MNHTPSPRDWTTAVRLADQWHLGIRHDGTAISEIVFLSAPPALAADQTQDQLNQLIHHQFTAWLANPHWRFDLPTRVSGTPFQKRVWAAIADIEPGQTRSYQDLARALATSARPVGGACGANPLPVIVPCHRVVAAQGLGGFSGNQQGWLVDIKRWLIEREAKFRP